ncbi:pancreatic lipase-related protein 3-like [Parasteatoda tepidariorum]|uniref:pancreatic lipase-related protein 3-like n=1 Tax=Parasteatoda tepidariorum TaxID=114398 RepID=UPI001C726236|nr:pancreatic lipase-related protein 3-like [Parasteatoda tepidariorum]
MMNGNRFHFIGHSYGAYIINEAARYIFEREPQNKIRRLTFLDPAIVPIKDGDPARKFRAEYAQFTDAIHGDAGRCFPVSLGLFNTFGHADFYPNGGAFQISCYSYAVTSLLKGDFFYALASFIYPPLCSHLQAIQYFKVSINHPQGLYIGAECKDFQSFLSGDCYRCCKKDFSKCAVMGMDAEKYFPHLHEPKKNRIYFLNLGLECPYNEDYEFSVFRDC